MLRRILIPSIIINLIGMTIASEAAQPFDYLIDAQNRITDIEFNSATVSNADNTRIVRIACAALTRLENDGQFKSAIENILKPSQLADKGAPAYALLQNQGSFEQTFLMAEQKLLADNGLSYRATFATLTGVSTAVRDQRIYLTHASSSEIVSSIAVSQTTVCSLAHQLLNARQLAAIEWIVGGWVVIAVDVGGGTAAVAEYLGLTAPAVLPIALASVEGGYRTIREGQKNVE